MPIKVDWYEEEKHNICYYISAIWTWDELIFAIDEVVILLDSVDYRVKLIIDITETRHFPTVQFPEMTQIARAPTMSHPNTAELLMVGENRYMKLMFRVFKRLFPDAASRYKLFANSEELSNHLNAASES